MDIPNDNFDGPWKRATMRYFAWFMAFYFAAAYAAIDWGFAPEFLDTDLPGLPGKGKLGPRRADLLVRVMLKDGSQRLLYIHIEIQACRDGQFAERVFTCHYRLYERYRTPIASLVILADRSPTWRPRQFGYEAIGCRLLLEFPIVKLLDYRSRLNELLADPNPFALFTAAHLLTLETRRELSRRLDVKVALVAILYSRGWTPQEVLDFLDVLDWLMQLPAALQWRFKEQLTQLEAKKMLTFTEQLALDAKTAGYSVGMEKGIKTGIAQGMLTGQRQLLLCQLTARFGALPADIQQRLDTADLPQLQAWGKALVVALSLEEIFG